MEDKVSRTYGRCSTSRCRTSWSSHMWSSPTAGCTRPCWRRSPPGRSYSDLREGGRQERAWEGGTAKHHSKRLLGPNDRFMQNKCTTERGTTGGRKQCQQKKPDLDWRLSHYSLHGWLNTSSLVQRFLFILQVRRQMNSSPSGLLWWHCQPPFFKSKCVLVDACMHFFIFFVFVFYIPRSKFTSSFIRVKLRRLHFFWGQSGRDAEKLKQKNPV